MFYLLRKRFWVETALKLISSHFHKRFIIYTDSRSVIESLQSISCSPSFISVLQLYNKLINKGFHILFCWVPAHIGIRGNKAADKAAKQACTPFNSPVPYSDVKLAINSFMNKNWLRDWDGCSEKKLNHVLQSGLLLHLEKLTLSLRIWELAIQD